MTRAEKGTVCRTVSHYETREQKLSAFKDSMARETELLYVVALVILILVCHPIMTWTDSRRNRNSLKIARPAESDHLSSGAVEEAHEIFESEKHLALFPRSATLPTKPVTL